MPDLFVRWILALVERQLVPDPVTRFGIRRMCAARLRSLGTSSAAEGQLRLQQFVERMNQAPVAIVPEAANQQHYELPPEFFALILGPRRKYSCCLFAAEPTTLDQAEEAALEQTCRNAELADGQEILDLGCGWGSLALWVLEKFPRSRVTAVSNSHAQRLWIARLAERRGFSDRLRLITADMNHFHPPGRYDRVVSVEMFEHMRNYRQLLERIAGWLLPDGKLLVHVFCHRGLPYEFAAAGASDWMARHFFTGGMMPSSDLLSCFPEHLTVERAWRWDGRHYARTCAAWQARLEENRRPAMELLRQVYAGQAQRWYQRWRLFFLVGSQFFAAEQGQAWYVVHNLLRRSDRGVHRPEGSSASRVMAEPQA